MKKKSTGHGKTLVLSISMPGFEMKEMTIELNKLNIFVGANGVGKSMIMKIIWALDLISQAVVGKQADLEGVAQFTLDNTIPDNKMIAIMMMEYDSGATIVVKMIDGKVNGVSYTGFEGINELQRPVFMSATMRTFSDMKHYLMVKKTVKGEMKDILKHYKLYDMMYVERLIHICPLSLKGSAETLKSFDIEGLETIVHEDDDFKGVWSDGRKESLSNLGSGHQSLINMTIGALS